MDQPTETGITCQRCRLCSKIPKREKEQDTINLGKKCPFKHDLI